MAVQRRKALKANLDVGGRDQQVQQQVLGLQRVRGSADAPGTPEQVPLPLVGF